MDWTDILIAVVSAVSGGGLWGFIQAREEKKKTPYDMLMEMLQEQKRFFSERNADYEREKLDSAEKSAVIMQTRLCKHRFNDPDIICPVDEANTERLKNRCNRCGYSGSEEQE